MKLPLIVILTALFQTVSPAFSQDEKPEMLRIFLDTNVMLIGDQINLHIQATLPKKMHMDFPDFNDSITPTIEIIEKFTPESVRNSANDFLQITHKYLITCFDSGLHFIPPMEFNIKHEYFDNYIRSDSIGLYVGTFEIETTKGFFDIKPPIKPKFSWDELKPYLVIILIVLLILILLTLVILYIIGKKRNHSFFRRKKPLLPPHEIAFRALVKIRNKKLHSTGKIKQYYTEITDVLRIYLEGRYGLHTLEKTSDEILLDVKENTVLSRDLTIGLRNILQESDLVKFAKKKPLANENEYFFKQVYSFIEETKMIEEEPTENEPS